MENEVLKYAQIIADECKGKETEVIAHLLAQIDVLPVKQVANLIISTFGKKVRIVLNHKTGQYLKIYNHGLVTELEDRDDAMFWAAHFGVEIEVIKFTILCPTVMEVVNE